MSLIQQKKWVWILILGAVLVGILYTAPSVLVAKKLHAEQRPFVLLQLGNHADEVEGYVARARQIYNGIFPPQPAIFPWLTTAVFSASIALSGGNINIAYLAIVFIFSAIIFAAFFLTARFFLKNDYWALFLAFAGSLTPLATHLPYAFTGFGTFLDVVVKNFYPGVATPLVRLFLARVDNPLLAMPFYLLGICALFWFWQKPTWKSAVVSAASVGFLSQIYLHYWAFLIVVSGLLGIYSLWEARRDSHRLKMFLIFFAVLALASMPYLFNYLHLKAAVSPDFFQRLGAEHGRSFRFSRVFDYGVYVILAALVWFYLAKKNRTLAIFFMATIVAMFMVWNLQLITGFQPELKWDRPIAVFIFLILASLVYYFGKNFGARKVAVALMILAALLVVKKVVNAVIFLNPPKEFLEEHTFDPALTSSWDWMNKNLPKNAVVASPSFPTSYYFSVYTFASPLLRPGLSTTISNFDLEERFLFSNKLFGVPRDILEKRLHRAFPGEDATGSLYYSFYEDQSFDVGYRNDIDTSLKQWSVPESKIKELLQRYDGLKISWKDGPAEYLYSGPREKTLSGVDFGANKNLELVYQRDGVEIWKIVRK